MHKILILSAVICIAYLPSILSIPTTGTCYGCSFVNNLGLDKRTKDRFRIILRDKSLTKREMDDQIEDLIKTQSPRIKEKFRTMKDNYEQKEAELRRKIQLAAEKLSPEARAAVQRMQAVSSNKDLTVDESNEKIKEIRRALSPKIRKELADGFKGIAPAPRGGNVGGRGRGNGNSGRGEQTRGAGTGEGCKKCGTGGKFQFNDDIDQIDSGENL